MNSNRITAVFAGHQEADAAIAELDEFVRTIETVKD